MLAGTVHRHPCHCHRPVMVTAMITATVTIAVIVTVTAKVTVGAKVPLRRRRRSLARPGPTADRVASSPCGGGAGRCPYEKLQLPPEKY